MASGGGKGESRSVEDSDVGVGSDGGVADGGDGERARAAEEKSAFGEESGFFILVGRGVGIGRAVGERGRAGEDDVGAFAAGGSRGGALDVDGSARRIGNGGVVEADGLLDGAVDFEEAVGGGARDVVKDRVGAVVGDGYRGARDGDVEVVGSARY